MKILFLTLISFLLLFSYLGKIALIDPDEPRYAEAAREMLVLKNYFIPHLNFIPRINKPILFYWLILLCYKLFGISEFTARLPSAIFGLILILGVYLWLRNEIGKERAYLSSIILLSTPAIFVASRLAIIDIVYITLIVFSLFSFWFSFKNKKFLILSYFLLGLSLATKGPAGLVIVFLTLLFFSLWQKKVSLLLSFFNPLGIIILLIVGGFWYFLLLNKIGFLEFKNLILQETWGRLVLGFVHREPFYYYLPVILLGFMPWSIFLIRFKKSDCLDSFVKYLLSFITVTFFFFSFCRSKLITYILPLFPALAVITSNIINRTWHQVAKQTLLLYLIMLSISVMLPFMAFKLLNIVDIDAVFKFSAFIFSLAIFGIYLTRYILRYQFWYLFSLPFLIYFYLTFNFGDDFSFYRSGKALFKNYKVKADCIYTLNFFEPSIVFYSGKKIEEINDISKFKHGEIIVKKDEFNEILKLGQPFELISETDKYKLIRLQKLQN